MEDAFVCFFLNLENIFLSFYHLCSNLIIKLSMKCTDIFPPDFALYINLKRICSPVNPFHMLSLLFFF